jgi:Helix-turn-helix/Protein of unknown function (DUF2442)
MRPVNKRPRILSAKAGNDFVVSAVFNNGETRTLDFKKILDDLHIDNNVTTAKLRKRAVFNKFTIENGTLSWKNVQQRISWGGSIRKVPFEIGADVLFGYSKPVSSPHRIKIGDLIKKERLAAGMTQRDLAIRSGTTAGYISRIEKDKSGIELDTLQKVVEHGLHKKLNLSFSNI